MSDPAASEMTAEEQAKKALADAMLGTTVPDPVNLEDLVLRLKGLDLPSISVLTPHNMQGQFNALSRHLSECQGIVSDLQARTTLAKKRARTMRMAVQLAKRFLFSGDPEVRAGRSLEDREAVASVKLSKEIIEVQQAETSVANFESALLMAQDRLRYLKDRRATLRDQKDLLQAEMFISRDGGYGQGYGGNGYGGSGDGGGSLRPTGPYAAIPERSISDILDPSSTAITPSLDEIRHLRTKLVSG